jgi:hypothetical protein
LLLYSPASVNTSFEIYAWGAQLSVGPYALDYTPTTSAAVYGPRFDYDPVTLAARGLLIEESRTNLLTYSEQFDNASWTVNNATVTANSTTAPDGTNTADLLTEDSSSGVHRLYKNITLTSVSHSASIYAKPNGRSWIYIRMDTASGLQAWFNISTGQVGTVQSGLTASIQSVGNGWYRCVISGVAVVSNNFLVGLSDANNGGNYAGDGTSGAYLWGAQLEAGSFATSYLPTLASTVTRSADVASVDTLSPWFNATTGTIYTEVNRYAENVDVRGTVFSDGTLDNYLGSSAYTFSGQGGVVVASSVGQVGLGSGSTSIGIKKFAFAYGANDFALSENGGSVTTDTSGTVPTLTMMGIGSLIAGYVGTGHVRRIAYYPRRLTDAELQALTA